MSIFSLQGPSRYRCKETVKVEGENKPRRCYLPQSHAGYHKAFSSISDWVDWVW